MLVQKSITFFWFHSRAVHTTAHILQKKQCWNEIISYYNFRWKSEVERKRKFIQIGMLFQSNFCVSSFAMLFCFSIFHFEFSLRIFLHVFVLVFICNATTKQKLELKLGHYASRNIHWQNIIEFWDAETDERAMWNNLIFSILLLPPFFCFHFRCCSFLPFVKEGDYHFSWWNLSEAFRSMRLINKNRKRGQIAIKVKRLNIFIIQA